MIGQEVQLATLNQKSSSKILPFFNCYLHAKNVRDLLIPFRDTNDQRILQSD